MKKTLTIVFTLSFLSIIFSQNIKIDWQGSTTIDYGTEILKIPHFNGENFSYDGSKIIFSFSKKTEKIMKAENLKWEKIQKKDLYDVKTDRLPQDNIISSSVYFNKYDQENISYLNIAALKIEKNEIYRLMSFDIRTEDIKYNSIKKTGTSENPLKSGNFYKIRVDKSGIFKITTKFLKDNGINPTNINPKNFRIYGNGGLMLPEYNQDFKYSALQENAIQVVGEDDGVWNDEDYVLFYAQGPNGNNLYKNLYGKGNKRTETRSNPTLNYINIYNDYAYYFINFDLGEGKRVQDMDAALSQSPITRYDDYQYINEEKYNLMKFGRIWTGEGFSQAKTISFTTRSAIKSTDQIVYNVRTVGYNAQSNNIKYDINGSNSGDFLVPESSEYALLKYSGSIYNLQGNQININITPDISANPNGLFYLDYAEVLYKEDLNYNGEQMNFRDYNIEENSGQLYSFSINNISGLEQVWDVSDITNANRKINKSGNTSSFSFGYTANSDIFNNEFVAFKSSSAYSPEFVGKIDNQDLSALQNIDYLMITSTEMIGQAQRLANFYQDKYNIALVDVNKIYNEFSSGSKDITAIRDFITKLNTPNGSLKYVFILGDTSYDFRGRSVPGSDIVPSYQSEESGSPESSYVTDDYFVMTSPQTSTSIIGILPNIPIGRLPAANITEAKLMIDKTLAYNNALAGQSTPFGEWKMKLDFVVDDDDDGNTPFHTTVNNSLVTNFETGTERKEYNIRKLYLDSFTAETSAGGQRYPQVNQALSNDMNNSLYIFYFGHGGINGWAQERVFSTEEIEAFNNYNNVYSRFPFVSTITCEFTLWDDPDTYSAGEQVIKSKQGGAATMITSSRKIGVTYGVNFTSNFTKNIFALSDDDFLNLGDAFLKARIQFGANANHLKINFLGDPAGKLSRPKRRLIIDEINSPVPGQIRALDFVTIKGHINKADGSIDESFNGRVGINIFDKRLSKKTLNNDGTLTPILEYTEEGSAIVKTSGTAVKGSFTVEFYVPKDINYELGEGRLLVYADNKSYDVFNNQSIQVGGINPDGIDDDEAPKANLYMNNVNFADGGITDQNPTFLACVTDNKGINSTGAGIGHDITVILDGQIIDTVVLNDFYSSGEGNGCTNSTLADYQKGYVTYPFRNLSVGEHQLVFKVWDINNNSTSGTLNFIVKDETDQKLIMNRLLNWPNPFTNKTYIQFEHNCDDILDVNVQIYTITGKLVKTISTTVSADPYLEGYRTPRTAIEWDGKDDYGDTVGKGTYIFKVFARSQNQDKCKGNATAIEKMVLLK